MSQAELWHDTILDAVGAAVQSAGGVKRVAAALWPTLGETAAQRLRSCLNPDHPQKLCPLELDAITKMAAAHGDYSIPRFVAMSAQGEFHALSPDEAKRRQRHARIKSLMAELAQLTSEGE